MGLTARRLQGSDLGIGDLRIIYLLQGVQTPKNPTLSYPVIAMSLEERTFFPALAHTEPVTEELPFPTQE